MNYQAKFEGVKQFRKHKKLFYLKNSSIYSEQFFYEEENNYNNAENSPPRPN
jgi:hypothetical protein